MYYAFIHIYKFFPTGVIIKIVFIKSSLSFHCKPKKTKGCTGWGLPVSPWFTVTDSKGVKRLKKWTVTTKFLTQTSRYSKWYKITASSKATQILLRMGTILAGGGQVSDSVSSILTRAMFRELFFRGLNHSWKKKIC